MDFRVLGPLEVTHAGVAVAVARPKCQALLALLICHHPHGLSPEPLADALWPEAESAKAANNLRVHLTYLRRALGEEPDVIPRTAGRYSLAVARDAIDTFRFEDAVLAARATAASGDPRGAIDGFESAFDEWRGDPHADLRYLDALRAEIVRLEELRLDAIEGYATALLDDDRADQACRVLEPVVEANPTREMLAARLMLALYRTGRQPDSLALFGRVKAALAEDLGLLPSDELQRLVDAIVMQRPELDVLDVRSDTPAVAQSPHVRGRPRQRAAFIGRGAELEALDQAWTRAKDGDAQLVYVVGDAGMGKTTVVEHFLERIRSESATVVTGNCDEDPAEPYLPFPDLVRGILEHAPPTDTVPSLLGELGRLTPELAARLPAVADAPEPGAGRQRLFTAVATLLAKPSQPRLLVLEDLHWAGPDALLLLRHVMRAATGQLMVLGTFRPDEVSLGSSLREVLSSGRLGKPDERITMLAMNRHEVAAVINGVAPVDRRSIWLEHLDELTDVSAGNPLRLREVLRQLELEPNAAVADIAPEDVRSLVDRRLDRLDATTRSVLHTGAVFGRIFTLSNVAAATSLSIDATLDALEESMSQGLVVEGDRADDFTFAHPLFRNAIYSSLSLSRRARMHIRCGDILATTRDRKRGDGLIGEVARHFVAARPVSDAERTAEFAREAGNDAARRYAHEEAVDWYRHAVECAEDGGWSERDLARLRLALGLELEHSGKLHAARAEYFTAADTARAIDDLQLLVEVVIAATPRATTFESDFATRLANLADIALGLLGHDDPRRIPLLRSAAFARFSFDLDAVERYACEGERLGAFSTDPQIRSWCLGLHHLASFGDDQRRLELSREIIANAVRHELVDERGINTRRLLIDLMVHGEMDEFDHELLAMGQLARSTAIPFDLYWAAALGASRAMMRDTSAGTEEVIRGAALLGRQLQLAEADGVHMLQMFAIRYQQGRIGEVTAGLKATTGDEPPVVAGTALLALAFAESQRPIPARRALDRVVTADEILLQEDNLWFGAVALFGGVAAAYGTRDQRSVLRHALAPRADRFCVFGGGGAVFGTGHHWLARLAIADGDLDAGRDHLAEAARICDYADAPFWSDRARAAREVLESSK